MISREECLRITNKKVELKDNEVLEITSEFTSCYQSKFAFKIVINDGLVLIETNNGTTLTVGYDHASLMNARFDDALRARIAGEEINLYSEQDSIETYIDRTEFKTFSEKEMLETVEEKDLY